MVPNGIVVLTWWEQNDWESYDLPLSARLMKRVEFERALSDLKIRSVDLARIVGVTPTTVSLWGKVDPATSRYRKVPVLLIVLLESWLALKRAGLDYPPAPVFPRDSDEKQEL